MMSSRRGSFLFSFSLFLICGVVSAAEVSFDVKLRPMGDFVGRTNDISGAAVLKNGVVRAENIKVNLLKIKTGMETRDKHAQKYLETDKFPEAILVKAEGKDGKGTGVLKIKGIEKPISGTYAISGSILKAEWKIKLSDYNITGVRYMNIGVLDEVTMHVDIPVKSEK